MAATASEGVLDFTKVKEGSTFNKKRQKEGDYEAKITAVADAPAKSDGVMQWMFTIQAGAGTYPYYCKHAENQLWKIRNLLIAAGMNVPKKRMKVDPNKLVGKTIGVTLEDDEYDGKPQSNIAATFPASELSNDDIPDEDDNLDPADDDDDDDTPPPPAAKKKAPAPVEEEEDEDEPEVEAADAGDQFDAMDRSELKQYIAANKLEVQVFKSMDDDAIRAKIREAQPEAEEEEEDEPTPPPAKKKKPAPKPAVDDDDLEEIDIDDT
jgi:hypothetical protein